MNEGGDHADDVREIVDCVQRDAWGRAVGRFRYVRTELTFNSAVPLLESGV